VTTPVDRAALMTALRERYAQPAALTEPLINGFVAAYALPGYSPAAAYVVTADEAGRLGELFVAADAAGRLRALFVTADAAGRLRALVVTADAAGLAALRDLADGGAA